ncbi:hypothetical protein [Litoreibacter halocynthiae]|uniref:hypothetical protein n=1 Tax=Litoreibacter halocynthiae TaxID=1242689 RepID=UPI0024907994|nr:hypothetical protein [Litoreibacter halocynthiae]
MADTHETYLEKHLARNVPIDFMGCLERERIAVSGDLNRRGRRSGTFNNMIAVLSEQPLDDADVDRLNDMITEVQLRYLVLAKTLDQTIPPTPIKHAIRSLSRRLGVAVEALADSDRDMIVRQLTGLPDGAPMPSTRAAFDDAQSIAERAAIAHEMVAKFAEDIAGLEEFFDYKSNLTPRGNQAKFAMIYAVGALADLFENENTLDRKASVNIGIRLNENADQGDWTRYTGLFLRFMIEFFRQVDDSEMATLDTNSFADRVRTLTAQRRKDRELFKLLHGEVQTDTLLEFMKRAEETK